MKQGKGDYGSESILRGHKSSLYLEKLGLSEKEGSKLKRWDFLEVSSINQ